MAYRLKLHHTRNLYLRAWLDTFADVNLMPASMYQLVFNNTKMQKLDPNNLQVGTYTTYTLKIVGTCTFYHVHTDTKKLIEVTFYVVMNDESVLLSFKTTLLLGLIQPRPRLDYLPPRASFITSSADHPKKIKAILHIQKQEVFTQTSKQEVAAKTPAAKRHDSKLITSKEMILCEYPDVFEGLASSQDQLITFRLIPVYLPIPTNPYTLKRNIPTRNKQDVTGRSTCSSA